MGQVTIIMLGLGAMFTFFLANRLPTREVKRKQRLSEVYTNLFIIAVILIANWLFGWRTYHLIQLPVFWFAGAAGVWLFYVQHQFPGGYWARKGEWEPADLAAMVFQQYRLLPCLPPEPQDTQLLFKEMLRLSLGAANQSTNHNTRKFFLHSTEFVGRKSAADGFFSRQRLSSCVRSYPWKTGFALWFYCFIFILGPVCFYISLYLPDP